jgi:exosome complex component RRP4
VAKIVKVTSQKLIDVSTKGPGLRKLYGGRIITVNCNKVPRIIGKQGSMVSLIKTATGCKIIVGQNGVIWLTGAPDQEVIAIEAIRKIEAEAHMAGLTERMTTYLEKRCNTKLIAKVPTTENPEGE